MSSLDVLLFAVWIPRSGWLKGSQDRIFATDVREVAESAARLYGSGSFVTEFDGQAMADLEDVFLSRERERDELEEAAQKTRATRGIRGLLWRISTSFSDSARS